ncbi:PERM1 protein, partial [Aphelocoma coerulescens]|nr:PERM1 protein [Aphelocoma coerulescens]
MDNFEYSIQLNDREWAEFFQASEECSLAPASLATAEEQCLSDIEQGDASGRDCPRSSAGLTAARPGSEPAAGTGSPAPRGVAGDTAPRWPERGHLSLPELLSGSEDEAELGSVGRFLCDSDEPRCRSPAAMPSAQRRQPPRPPAATPAGGTAQGSPGQDAAEEKGAAGGGQAMEPPGPPEQGGDAGGGRARGSALVAQPAVVAQPEAPAASASPQGSAGKGPASAAPSEPGVRGPAGDPPSPSPGTVPRVAQEEERAGTEPSSPGGSPSVVRPKVPAQPRKSRRQRGASATEGDRDPAGAAAPGAAGAGKAPPGSPMSPRKGRGKEKAAKGALVRLGSEEAADSKRSVPGPGVDGGDPGTAAPKQRGKEPGAQSPGKTKATKYPKAAQAGGSGVRDSVPVPAAGTPRSPAVDIPRIPAAEIPRIPDVEIPCEPTAGIPPIPAAGIPWEAAAETPREMSPLCFADGASARPSSLDVTWPEMYDYLFCDSQEEEDELGSSVEGWKSPLQREFCWPELYEHFFNEPEGSRKKGKAKDRKRKEFSSLDHAGLQKEDPSPAAGKDTVFIPVPDVYGHCFPERAQSRMGWRGIFSMAPASEVKKAVGALKSLLQRQIQLGGGQAPASQALVPRGSGEKLALVPLGGAQVWPGDAGTALALRGKPPEDPRVLSHKDMCLVFCAFASWAVKTSDLQAPDAWKTMFLASFGTLSAIRYFRRQVREGHPRT